MLGEGRGRVCLRVDSHTNKDKGKGKKEQIITFKGEIIT